MGNKSSSTFSNVESSTDLDSITQAFVIEAIGGEVNILQYANAEWQGNTTKALCIREGYCSIPRELGYTHLRKIRGDNYCGVRAVLYQILSRGLPIPNTQASYNRLKNEMKNGGDWLKEYTFGRRLSYPPEDTLKGIKECFRALDNIVHELENTEHRDRLLQAKMNNNTRLDVQLCEAVKLHMLSCALELYKKGEQAPFFSVIMYARSTSGSPKDFLKYHLNPVGDSAGLEQIEMFLLGHTLGVTIQVVRPSSFSCEDFVCYYPDTHIDVGPLVPVIAEDDRHYNILVK